jgi:hypothetical protein
VSQTACLEPATTSRGGPVAFAAAGLALMFSAALLAGWAPLSFTIVTVFLFAGPHNWLEFRYLLTRMPAYWGRQRAFFSLALGGALALSVGMIALYALAEWDALDPETWRHGYACLHSLVILWIATLAYLRSRLTPQRDWSWIWPIAFTLVAVAWLAPDHWGLVLVYLHPLMAFWLLDRELRRSRPSLRPALLACLAVVPLVLVVLWWRLSQLPDLADTDDLALRITAHVGAGLVPGVPSRLLVATHAFLEMLHYGVWVVAMPLLGVAALPWDLRRVPLALRGTWGKWGVSVFLLAGFTVVVVLWGCFLADYTTTRTVYFVVALVHVLAEFPFLIRSL